MMQVCSTTSQGAGSSMSHTQVGVSMARRPSSRDLGDVRSDPGRHPIVVHAVLEVGVFGVGDLAVDALVEDAAERIV
jgi:hypothetical protein